MSLLSTSYFLLPLRLPENEPPELAEEELVGRGVFGVGLEASALEVLHAVGLAVFELLLERFAEWQAELVEAAIIRPVGIEVGRDIVARLREPGLHRVGVGRWVGGADTPPELPDQDFVVLVAALGVIFEARALEVLHDVGLPILQDLIDLRADRVAVDREVAVRLPVGE